MRPEHRIIGWLAVALALLLGVSGVRSAQQALEQRRASMSAAAEKRGLAEPFKGVTTNGTVVPGLFPVRSTGVSTAAVQRATAAFLQALTPEQRKQTTFPLDD